MFSKNAILPARKCIRGFVHLPIQLCLITPAVFNSDLTLDSDTVAGLIVLL
jgi:hypothetical protein